MSDTWVGIIAIVVGLIFCFRGYLAMRTVITIWGGFVGFALGSALAQSLTGEPPLSGPVSWIQAGLGALLLAWLSYAFYVMAVIITMGSVGYGLGLSLAGFVGGPGWLGPAIGLAGAALLVIVALATQLPQLLLVLVSASGGASAIVGGIALVTGIWQLSALTGPDWVETASSVWWLDVLLLALFVLGVIVQLRNRSKSDLRAAYR